MGDSDRYGDPNNTNVCAVDLTTGQANVLDESEPDGGW